MFGNTFLGEVVIPLDKIDYEKGYTCWHMLQGRPRKLEDKSSQPNLGSLRLKVQYTSDYVLSSRYYQPLKNFILQSPDMKVNVVSFPTNFIISNNLFVLQPVCSSAVFILGEIVGNKIDAAQPLVKLFISTNRVIPFITSLAEWEISRVT